MHTVADPSFISPHAGSVIDPSLQVTSPPASWFRSNEGRRFGIEIGLVIAVKLALLAALWLVLIQPWPRPAATAAAAVQQLYLPAASADKHD